MPDKHDKHSSSEQADLLEVADTCLCFKARNAARLLTRFYDRYLAGTGLEPTQFNVLVAIRLSEPVPIRQLADRLGLERTTFTRNLHVLQRDGLVAIQSGTDARTRLLSLTPDGQRALKLALPRWKQAQEAAVSVLGKRKFAQLSQALSLSAQFNNLN